MKRKCCHAIRDGSPHFFYISPFGPDPHGRAIAKYGGGGFRPFGPRTAHKSRAGAEKQERPQFPGPLGPETEEKKSARYPGSGCPQFFSHLTFWRTGSPQVKYAGFRPFLPRTALREIPWHLEKSWARVENGKTQFPGGHVWGKSRPPQKFPPRKCAVLLHLLFRSTGPPRMGKFRVRAENLNFPVLGALFGGNSGRRTPDAPQTFLPESAQLFYIFYVLADRTPTGGKSKNAGLVGPFGLGQPFGTWRNSGRKREKRKRPH